MLNKNDIITLEITDITQDANGVGRYEQMAVFVPYTAVGDIVSVRIVQVRSRFCFGIVEEVLTPSPARNHDSGGPVYSKCGGCSLRHISYESELSVKNSWVRENFRRIGKIEAEMEPIVGSPLENNYRNKAIYPIALENNTPVLGFYAKRSHRIIPISDCPLHPSFFGDIANAFLRFLKEYDISIYDEVTHKGLVRALFLRYAESTGEVMVTVIVNGTSLPKAQKCINSLQKSYDKISSVILNVNTQKGNVLLGDQCITLFGEDSLTDVLCGVTVELSPLSFYQVNKQGAERLYAIAQEFAELTGNETVVDLYCGAGTIGLSMAHNTKSLIGVEIVSEAVENAKKNAARAGITNARFICGDASHAAKLLEQEGIHADVVIVDPPRKGLTPQLIERVANIAPKRVVMVSCDSATAARDAGLFAQQGYSTKKIRAVDMFPKTGHVECVVLMTKE